MKVVRRLTGFWAAYPLAQDLEPGLVGQKVKGRFEPDSHLSRLQPVDHSILETDESPALTPVDSWIDQGVEVTGVGGGVDTPHLPVDGKISVKFSSAEQGVVLCTRAREWAFRDLRGVKAHVLQLAHEGHWGRDDILITSVMKVERACVLFSTKRNQSLDVSVGAVPPVPIPGANEFLKLAIGEASFTVDMNRSVSSGYAAELDAPGTPLFQAIQIRGIVQKRAEYIKGAGDFREPSFGDDS
jgi:hypothetical protein